MKTRCWLWTAADNGAGYGVISITRTTMELAHRVSWELYHHRKLPKGAYVRHKCDVRLCVRPSHLIAGTQAKNLEDMSRKGRSHYKKLTPNDVREIRRLYATGEIGHRPLAKKFGVSRAMIRSVVSRQSWKWVA